MSTKEETKKSMGAGCCQSMMDKCFNPESKEGKAAFNFKDCAQMMKQFCGKKDGKFDFEACMSKMEQFCKSMKKESGDNVTK
jgi:hypothetical protein